MKGQLQGEFLMLPFSQSPKLAWSGSRTLSTWVGDEQSISTKQGKLQCYMSFDITVENYYFLLLYRRGRQPYTDQARTAQF